MSPSSRALRLLAPLALASWPALGGLPARLPAWLLPAPARYAHVLGLDEDGRVVHDLRDPEGRDAPISSARKRGGWLYLGSLTERGIGRVPAPRPPPGYRPALVPRAFSMNRCLPPA